MGYELFRRIRSRSIALYETRGPLVDSVPKLKPTTAILDSQELRTPYEGRPSQVKTDNCYRRWN